MSQSVSSSPSSSIGVLRNPYAKRRQQPTQEQPLLQTTTTNAPLQTASVVSLQKQTATTTTATTALHYHPHVNKIIQNNNDDAQRKRIERPWERNTTAAATIQQATNSTDLLSSVQDDHHGSMNQKQPSSSLLLSCTSSDDPMNDTFDDGNMDWDEAIRVMDSAVDATTTSASMTMTQSSISPPTMMSLQQPRPQPQLPMTKPTVLASLRPASWNNNSDENGHAPPDPPKQQQQLQRPSSSAGLSSQQPPQILSRQQPHPSKMLPPSLQFDWDRVNQPVQDQYTEELIRNATVSEPLQNGWTLFPHQQKAITTALYKRRHILALDMGLGKTLIGCCWARAFVRTMSLSSSSRPMSTTKNHVINVDDSCEDDDDSVENYSSSANETTATTSNKVKRITSVKVIIVCPVSLKQEWQRTAEDATGLIVDPTGMAKRVKDDDDGENSTTTTQGRVPKRKRKTGGKTDPSTRLVESPQVMIASWGKVPTGWNNGDDPQQKYVVIADEAHSMQNMSSARTQDALRLMTSPNAVGVLLLTGTPMKNGKPANLFPLLKAVQHPLGRDQRAYEIHFCDGRYVQYGRQPQIWIATGANNCQQLHTLTQTHLLYMNKNDCLHDLPAQTRIVKTVPVSSQSQLRHNAALQALAKIYNTSNDSSNSSNNNNDAVLGALQNLRRVDCMAKVDATVAVAMKVLEDEAAVVLFTSFVDVAKLLHTKLNEAGWKGEILTGETPANKRQARVDNFQKGLSPVFICTFGAGGVGLTLTAAATVILIDRPWTPGEVYQAEDRVRRIGQTRPVTSIWMSAFELDVQIDSMLASKNQTATSVLAVKGSGNQQQQQKNSNSMGKLSIHKLLQSLLPLSSGGTITRESTTTMTSSGLTQTTMLQYTSTSKRQAAACDDDSVGSYDG